MCILFLRLLLILVSASPEAQAQLYKGRFTSVCERLEAVFFMAKCFWGIAINGIKAQFLAQREVILTYIVIQDFTCYKYDGH